MNQQCTKKQYVLSKTHIETPLGQMIAVADTERLHLLAFADTATIDQQMAYIRVKASLDIIPGNTQALDSITHELDDYFAGSLTSFKTPMKIFGTDFQNKVWSQLQHIAYGQTCSYMQLANSIGQPTAHRAVANANAANRFALIIPCHRVIRKDGTYGGYAAGTTHKEWLLTHEKFNKGTYFVAHKHH